MDIVVVEEALLPAERETVWALCTDITHMSSFVGYGPIPGIESAVWIEGEGEGGVREVRNTDGTTHREEVLALRHPALVEDRIYRHHHKMFPVTDGGRLLGLVTTQGVLEVPRERWGAVRVRDVFEPLGAENTVSPDGDALEALSKMRRSGRSRLLVVSRPGQLVGVLSLKDLLDFFHLKLELEQS